MKWIVYLIRLKDSEAGKDVYVGVTVLPLERRLLTHKQLAEERGSRNEAGFELYKRMQEVGPENWEIEPLESASSSDEAKEAEIMTRNLFNADLNEWFQPEF